jgi:hypothetical protein
MPSYSLASPFPRRSSSTACNDGIVWPESCRMLGDLFGGCGGKLWFIHRLGWRPIIRRQVITEDLRHKKSIMNGVVENWMLP